jgi:anti-anti-sigma factor
MIAPVRQQGPLPQLSARGRGGVTVASLRGELDFAARPALQAHPSDIRWRGRPRCVTAITGLAFTDSARLGVLVRDSGETRAWGGSFALAGPQGAVRKVGSVTGLITWFEVHDTAAPAAEGPRTCGQAAGEARQAAGMPANQPGHLRSPGSVMSGRDRPRRLRQGHAPCRAGSSPVPGARAGSWLRCQGLLALGRELDDGGQA